MVEIKSSDDGFSLSYEPGIKNWFNSVSAFPNAQVQNEKLEFPIANAKGYARIHTIEDGLTYRIVNYVLNKDMEIETPTSDKFTLDIYFYQFTSQELIHFKTGDNIIETKANSYRAIVLTNSTVSKKLIIKKGSEVKGVTIEMSEEWIMKNVGMDKSVSLLKSSNFLLKVLTAKPKKILDEIFSEQEQLPVPQLYFTTRILRLLDNYLQDILRENSIESLISTSPKDFESVLKIESLLLQNYEKAFPKIENLARIALMSESKLKKIYKQCFGMGLYEYYQKNRMHKAKDFLLSGKYSVSEVGAMLGYSNLSNFSTSFKKEFNQLPKNYFNELKAL